jgi:hypothetical protein
MLRLEHIPSEFVVFPVLRGIFIWEQVDGATLLFEISNYQKILRGGYRDKILMSNVELSKYGKFVNPRKCTKEKLVSALNKMDTDSFDGCCIIQYDNTLEFVLSDNCVNACIQFNHWLIELCQFCECIEDVEHNIKDLHKDDLEMHYFCSKHFFYIISSLRPMENETILQCLEREWYYTFENHKRRLFF